MKINFALNRPESQGLLAFIIFIVGVFILNLMRNYLPPILALENAYVAHCIIILLFGFINAVSIFSVDNEKLYWTRSLYTFIALLTVGIVVSSLVTGIGIMETKSFAMIYPLITGCYLVIFIIATLIKKILIYADEKP